MIFWGGNVRNEQIVQCDTETSIFSIKEHHTQVKMTRVALLTT